MRHWTHEQVERPLYTPSFYLTGTTTPGEGDYRLFLFASLPKGGLDPMQTLLSPRCYPLLDERPQSLIPLPK